MVRPIFFIGEELSVITRQWLHRQQIHFIEFPMQKIEKLVSGTFDAYLFFSPSGIDSFKNSGNFPNPTSLLFANENSTARTAWRVFTNKVHTSPISEELSFVQYSIFRWMNENNAAIDDS
ncbi:MAG TPA: hypothetical protein VFC65_18790 [Prolixibacteraceae bacterium]|nr:hypothetical protein [Prolixibacteraceae bacterium]